MCTSKISSLPVLIIIQLKIFSQPLSSPPYPHPAKTCSSLRCPSEKCIQLPTGPQCHCGKGYTLNSVTSSCEDIDECKTTAICSQKCRNLPGSFECTCVDNFQLSSDNKTCVSNVNVSSWIYFTTKFGLYKYNLEQNYEIRIVDHYTDVVAVAADDQYVYWTSIEPLQQSLSRMSHNGSQSEVIALNGVGSPEGLAVDWWTDNIYFTDAIFNHISVCGNFGRHCLALVAEGLHKPRGLALNPSSAQMYWTDWGDRPHIGVAYMDGKDQEAFVDKDVHWPNGLTIDYPTERLYWVDAKIGSMESILLNGEDRKMVRRNAEWHAYNVQVLGDQLYWTEKTQHTLKSMEKLTGKRVKILVSKPEMRSLYVYHPLIYKRVNDSANPCYQNHCSQLCLLAKNSKFTCSCSNGGSFQGEICTEDKNVILIGHNHNLYEMQYTEVGLPTITAQKRMSSLGKYTIDRMTVNPTNRDIIVADNSLQMILKISPSHYNNKITRLVTKDIGKITCLAIDPLANNLYWTDSDRRTVDVFSFHDQHRTTIFMFHDDFIPYSFVLAPKVGKLFVAVNRNPVKIFQMSMSGAGTGKYLQKWKTDKSDKVTVSLAIDEEHSVVYVGMGHKIVSWNYAKNDDEYYRNFLPVNLNQLVLVPSIDRFFWTASDGYIYWNSPALIVDKSLVIPKAIGKSVDAIPIAYYGTNLVTSNHPCSVNNGGCSDICISSSSHFTCLCGLGRIFKSPENRTCMPQIDCEFRCDNGACLTSNRYCNGKKDCSDGSDEVHCPSHEITANHVACSYDEFKCFDGSECLEISQKCDHHTDCKDSSDELHCENFNLTTRCHKHQFLCKSLKCVDLNSLCDNYDDCGDLSDETICESPKNKRPTCGDLYDCGNGQCVDKSWLCDGETDCDNADDESSCPHNVKYCREGYFECGDHTCIHLDMVCDGHQDCPGVGGGADEWGCDKSAASVVLPKDCDFQCHSNRSMCLPKSKVCDGYADCDRGEDEKNCSLCRDTQFECGSVGNTSMPSYEMKRCIERTEVCDKMTDCRDGSDELNCDNMDLEKHSKFTICNKESFHCNNGQCIDMFRVCDLNHDCSDGSDEGGKCDSACDDHHCQQDCKELPTGSVCSCYEGYELGANGKSCMDVNECLDNPCAQRCENTYGSYTCSCYPNFMLHSNKHRCKALGAHRYALYSSQSQVRKMSSFPNTKEIFWDNPMHKDIEGMAVNVPKKLLYTTSMTLGSVYQIDLKSKTTKAVETSSPEKIAVDWGSGNLYISDNSGHTGGRVRVCNFESKKCVTIVTLQKFTYIDHMVVDAREQLLFFCTEAVYHGVPADKVLYSVRLDGTRRKIVEQELPFRMFTVDVNKRTIYFADVENGNVMEINYDGHQKKQIATGLKDLLRPHIRSMATFQNYIFIAVEGKPYFISCSVSRREDNCFTTQMDVANVNHFIVVQDTVQPEVENVCKNHRCSRICIPTKRGPKCLCNKGIQVGPGEECPGVENEELDDLVDVSSNEIESAMRGTDLEPSVAGRVVLVLMFILCALAGITFFIYRRRYLMSTFTIT